MLKLSHVLSIYRFLFSPSFFLIVYNFLNKPQVKGYCCFEVSLRSRWSLVYILSSWSVVHGRQEMRSPIWLKDNEIRDLCVFATINATFIPARRLLSGVARAFPGGRAAHPEDQIEEENEEKIKENWLKM